MTVPPPEAAPPVSLVSRVLFFGAGLVALAVATLITLGTALAGVISIGIAAYAASRRKSRLTRRGAWFASVGGTVAVLAVLIGFVVLTDETSNKPMTAAERAEQRARATQGMPDWLKAVNPNVQRQGAVADSMANRLLENRVVVVWAGLMGAVVASAIIGTIAGSFAWGGLMLLYRGYRGRWMETGPGGPGIGL